MKGKPLDQQVMVLTGASSGIGLVTARKAAEQGVRLVLAARNEEALRDLVAEIEEAGGEAIYVVADVSREEDVTRIAQAAVERFGVVDTWVNNAATSIFGLLEEVPIEEQRRLFDINYWGMVYGSLRACELMARRGGTIINVGSALSDRAIPIQGVYSATKHAIEGFTEALRVELEQTGKPITVSLIRPAAIDTPYLHHAKNYMNVVPNNPPPVYAPDLVADAILHATTHGPRDLPVGGGHAFISLLSYLAPRSSDKVIARIMPLLQKSSERARPRSAHNLYRAGYGGHERGGVRFVLERSVYTSARKRPVASAAMVAAVGAAAMGWWRVSRRPQLRLR